MISAERIVRCWFSMAVAAVALTFFYGCSTPRLQPRGGSVDVAPGDRPQAKAPFTFVVIGDTRPGRPIKPGDPASVSADYLRNIKFINKLEPSFVVNLGDMIRGYNSHNVPLLKRQWHEFDKSVARLDCPLYMVMGNHDAWNPQAFKLYEKRYGTPYYSFAYKGARFFVLSSEVPGERNRITGKQLEWLKIQLEKYRGATHKFIFLHKPLWLKYRPYYSSEWGKNIQPLLREYRVDAVFAGHEHFYEPFKIDGIPYFISGGGGAELDKWPKVGAFFHFLKVSVPVEGKPLIRVVREGKECPIDVVPMGLRRMVEGVEKSLNESATWVLNSGVGMRIEYPLENVFKETVQVYLEWKGGGGLPVEKVVAPQTCDVFLELGKPKPIVFFADKVDKFEDVPKLLWKLYEQGELVASGNILSPTARSGRYITNKKDAGKAALVIGDKRQIVSGRQAWSGPNDCSATACVVKGTTGLLVMVDVKDDDVRKSGAGRRYTDHVSMFFDFRPDGAVKGDYSKGAFWLDAMPDGSLRFHPDGFDVPGAMARTTSVPGGYHVDVFLPYEGLTRRHVAPGKRFNFDFGINDCDKGGSVSSLMWSGDRSDRYSTRRLGRLRKTK